MQREELWTRGEELVSEDLVEKIMSDYKKYAEEKMPMEYIL
jgi:hypothetical protein